MIQDNFKEEISKYLGGRKNIHLYWKGRVALYALLKAMDVGEGDEVILPAYTCVAAVNPIIYTAATPIYVDVWRDTYNINVALMRERVTPRTKVLICQNMYGLSTDLDEIQAFAGERGIFTIEDCTHGFSGTYKGRPNGTTYDASFFSTQWNKPFTSGIGGFSLVNNVDLKPLVDDINDRLINPKLIEVLSLRLQFSAKRLLLNDSTYWKLIRIYRFLSKHRLVTGSSGGDELSATEMPNNFFKRMSEPQMVEGLRAVQSLDEINRHRKRNAKIYTDHLEGLGKNHVDRRYEADHLFLKYPLLVRDRAKFFKLAERHRIRLGDWFLSPIHPIKVNLERWGFRESEHPNATFLSNHVVNLPTDTNDASKVVRFLTRFQDQILPLES